MDMAVWVLFNIYHKGAGDKSSKLGMPYFDPQKKKKKKPLFYLSHFPLFIFIPILPPLVIMRWPGQTRQSK